MPSNQLIDGKPRKYYHGGPRSLRHIYPPSVTGARSLSEYGADGVCRTDRVYVTTSLNAALLYAAMHPSMNGVVYEVTPHGALEHDTDCDTKGLSYSCESASILRVIKPSGHTLEKIRQAVIEDEAA